MKKTALIFSFLVFLTFPVSTKAQVDLDLNQRLQRGSIIVGHNEVTLFDQIPDIYLERAGNIKVYFSNQSVGMQIGQGLDCFAATDWASSPNVCRKDYYDENWSFKVFNHDDYLAGTVPEGILFDPDPVKYDRRNWVYEHYGYIGWEGVVPSFLNLVQNQQDKDVLSFQFTYLHPYEGSSIDDVVGGFFDLDNNPQNNDINQIENYEQEHPNQVILHMTSSLARSVGTQDAENFNNQMRNYIQENNKILLDVADIESHKIDGTACFDNRDGVQYCRMNGGCENEPDDGQNILAMCQEYTTDINGGHLTGVSPGNLRIGKAFWVVMAQIAGWDPSGTTTPLPTPSPTSQPTVTPTTTPAPTMTPTGTPVPTPTPIPGDANEDSLVNKRDYVIWVFDFVQQVSGTSVRADFNNDGLIDGVDYVIWLQNFGV